MHFRELVQALHLSPEQTSLAENPTLNPALNGVAALDQAQPGTLSFWDGARRIEQIAQTQASVLIVPESLGLSEQLNQQGLAWIATEQPRLLFAQALQLFYEPWRPVAAVHAAAVVHASVQRGTGGAIAAHVVVHENVVLGAEVVLHAHAVIYPGAVIGDRTVIHAGAVIHERSQIGRDCTIHSGAVIGAEGFGFVPTAEGWYQMPQSGRVVIEDDVNVGCNTTIDRPAIGETRIGQGTKIDNLVQIGHGCKIGHHCVLVSQVGLAGGVTLGDRVVLAGQVGVAEKLTIGAGTVVTAKSGVVQDIGPQELVSGFPAMPNKLWLRTSLLIKRLPELFRKAPDSSQKP